MGFRAALVIAAAVLPRTVALRPRIRGGLPRRRVQDTCPVDDCCPGKLEPIPGQPHLSARAHVMNPPLPSFELVRAILTVKNNHTPAEKKVGRARAAATTRAWHRLASRTRAFAAADARRDVFDGGGAAGASTS